MSKIIVLVGPTGIGKTKLSIMLAKKYNAEIINTDRMAMYKETSIGTAKVTDKEMEGIVHYFISNISLNDYYTIYDFQKEGRKVLDNLIKKNRNVIVVGGSGLYTKALLYDYKLEDEVKINDSYENLSNEELKALADSISENDIHKNNRKKLIRFINSYKSGNSIKNSDEKDKPLYNFIIIGLTTEREELYKRLNDRVDKMIKVGLVEEAKKLYEKEYYSLSNIIGYKELIPYFKGELDLESTIEDIKKDTRHYAKRQYTWYRHQFNNINWFNVDFNNINNTFKEIDEFISLQ